MHEPVLRERKQRAPVHHTAGLHTRRGDDRRREVDVLDELRATLTGRDVRPADDQRHADRRLVEEHLPLRHAVLAVEEAVVRREDDVRLVELPDRRQLVDDPRHGLVDREQRLEALLIHLADPIDPPGGQERSIANGGRLVRDVGLVEGRRDRQRLRPEHVPVARRRRRRPQIRRIVRVARPAAVRGEEGDRQEERTWVGGLRGDQVDGLLRVDVGLVVRGAGAVVDGPPVLVERVVVEAVRRRVDRAVPQAPARRDLGRVARAVAVQVLAEMDRLVAATLQPDRERVRAVELVVAPVRRCVAPDAVVVRVLPGEVGRPGRAAERIRDEAVVERDALVGEQRLHVGHDAHRLDRLVVGHDHDDVRADRRRGLSLARRAAEGRHGDDSCGEDCHQNPAIRGCHCGESSPLGVRSL